LVRNRLGFADKRLGVVVALREIDFVESSPKNRAGKMMRRLRKTARPDCRRKTVRR
jgi:acyl-coenzyme A synthetase/AMP-(fatty) acid ligase